jgi:hypothetical protein
MIKRKQGEKFVFTDKNQDKYLLKTILFTGDLEDHCNNCFFNDYFCVDAVDLTGSCIEPSLIFICLKTKKHI